MNTYNVTIETPDISDQLFSFKGYQDARNKALDAAELLRTDKVRKKEYGDSASICVTKEYPTPGVSGTLICVKNFK